MGELLSSLHFKGMVILFGVRDFLLPREEVLKEVGIKHGSRVLDFGCGPGSYVAAASKLAGESGKVYALDVNPLAVQMVRDIAAKNQMGNVETILSDCKTGLPDGCIDFALLYDILHELDSYIEVLEELHRVLASGGTLSVSDHHMKESEIISKITSGGLFRLQRKGKRTITFLSEKI